MSVNFDDKNTINLEESPIRITTSLAPSKSITTPSLINIDFDTKIYVDNHFNFLADFSSSYKMESHVGSGKMSNLVETHILRGLTLECLMLDAHIRSDMFVVNLKTKLNTIRESLIQA